MNYKDEKELEEIIKKVRIYINDTGKEEFKDEEIKIIVDEACCIWTAVADLWELKSIKLDFVNGNKKYTVGKESYENNSPSEILGVFAINSEKFRNKCTCGNNLTSGIVISSNLDNDEEFYTWLE